MLSNVSDDLAKWEVDHLLIYYSCPTKNNAIFGMHALHFFLLRRREYICRVAGTQGGVEEAPVACFLFHILILKVCVDFMEEEQFFTHWSEARGDVRFCTRPVTEEDNGFACENQSHMSRELEHL